MCHEKDRNRVLAGRSFGEKKCGGVEIQVTGERRPGKEDSTAETVRGEVSVDHRGVLL